MPGPITKLQLTRHRYARDCPCTCRPWIGKKHQTDTTIVCLEVPMAESDEAAPGVLLDFDAAGNP